MNNVPSPPLSDARGTPARGRRPFWVWAGIGCGALALIWVIASVGATLWLRRAAVDPRASLVVIRVWAALGGNRIIAIDEEAGIVTMQERATGDTLRINIKEMQERARTVPPPQP